MATLCELDTFTHTMGYKRLINKPSDTFQCQVSYLVAQGGFEIFVHISMVKTKDIFNFFW
jgi:hypothetical protein